ncbi:uncharacterized protein LOC125703823 isoform X6 [Lagopus muta]|uniref:uncharacterized protein LOC125703823 isoform X5 n=1 Tax=Lagopus muta TaxID=64668 RepID=UPI00209EDB66|nr:uncharacterized protein LOC125703823 isoform X5 [Lagopus muta]XP_048824806.1 uncharacterized protein LOC125703823 isoform X6 [Lagopus muta]
MPCRWAGEGGGWAGIAAFPHTSPAHCFSCPSRLQFNICLQQSSNWPQHVHLRQGLGEAARSGHAARDGSAGSQQSECACISGRAAFVEVQMQPAAVEFILTTQMSSSAPNPAQSLEMEQVMPLVLPLQMIVWVRILCLCLWNNPEVSCECLFPWRQKRSCSPSLLGCNLTSDPFKIFRVGLSLEGHAQSSHEYFFTWRSMPHFSGKVTAAPLQLREPRPLYLGRGIPWPTARAYRSLREKEAPHVGEALLTCV